MPSRRKSQISPIMYQATVTRQDNNKDESYVGLADNTCKKDIMAIQTASEMENKKCCDTEQLHLDPKR